MHPNPGLRTICPGTMPLHIRLAELAAPTQVRQLQPGAVNTWWDHGHPGWAIYPTESEQFMANALDPVHGHEQIVAPLPPSSTDTGYSGELSDCCWCSVSNHVAG